MKAARFRYAAAAIALVVCVCISTVSARAGLLALYSFNGNLKDSSGHGKTAHASGAPTYVDGAPFGGRAISFDGSGHAIVTAPLNISPAALPQLTMGAWVNASSVATPQYGIISNDDGSFDRSLDIDNRPLTGGAWSAFVGGEVVGKVAATPNKWIFIAVSFDQAAGPSTGTYKFYVNDGSKTITLAGADNFDANSVTTGVTIGRNPNFDQPFTGKVADAFFYAGILTKEQIEKIIARGPSAIPR
jgi:hypothetical protein